MSRVNEQASADARTRGGATALICFQYAVVAVFLLGAVSLLLAAAIGTGDWAGLTDPRLERYGDPKNWNPPIGPESVWNPLLWVVELCRWGVMTSLVVPLGFIGALLGLVHLAGRGPSLRRGTFVSLVVSTALCAAVAVVNLTPYGGQLRNWLLD